MLTSNYANYVKTAKNVIFNTAFSQHNRKHIKEMFIKEIATTPPLDPRLDPVVHIQLDPVYNWYISRPITLKQKSGLLKLTIENEQTFKHHIVFKNGNSSRV